MSKEIVSIHHFGSTSIKRLESKLIIDILAIVREITLVDQYNGELELFGYKGKGEKGIPGRRYFQKGGDDRTHHLHIYQIGSLEIERHLAVQEHMILENYLM